MKKKSKEKKKTASKAKVVSSFPKKKIEEIPDELKYDEDEKNYVKDIPIGSDELDLEDEYFKQ